LAVQKRRAQIVEFLLRNEVLLNSLDNDRNTPAHYASDSHTKSANTLWCRFRIKKQIQRKKSKINSFKIIKFVNEGIIFLRDAFEANLRELVFDNFPQVGCRILPEGNYRYIEFWLGAHI
jgi:hypothetical protein